MDFAANIEKVREVRRHFHLILSGILSFLFSVRLVLGRVDIRSCWEDSVEWTWRKFHRSRQLGLELHLLADSEAEWLHQTRPYRAGAGNVLLWLLRSANQMLIQVTNDQGIYRKCCWALAKWALLVLPASPSRTWTDEGAALKPRVKIQAHSESSAYVQVGIASLYSFQRWTNEDSL